MKSSYAIFESLVSCRNILLNGHTNEHIVNCLEDVMKDLDLITISSTKSIIAKCVPETLQQVEKSRFSSAGMILNLIHNLPLNEENEQQWSIDYFLSMELAAFLENYEEIYSSRMIALYVCSQLATRYSEID